MAARLLNKLKSRRGASMIVALVLFFLCLTVGAMILTAATVNVGQAARLNNEEQAYLTVSSAAKLLRDGLSGMSFSASRSLTVNADNMGLTTASTTYSEPIDGLLCDRVGDSAKQVFLLRWDDETSLDAVSAAAIDPSALPSGQLTVKGDSELELDDVLVNFSMDADFNITAELSIAPPADGGEYTDCKMTLSVPAVFSAPAAAQRRSKESYNTGEKDEFGNDIMSTYVVTTSSRNVSVTWGNGVIEGGGDR